jgi:hypothetical protein
MVAIKRLVVRIAFGQPPLNVDTTHVFCVALIMPFGFGKYIIPRNKVKNLLSMFDAVMMPKSGKTKLSCNKTKKRKEKSSKAHSDPVAELGSIN